MDSAIHKSRTCAAFAASLSLEIDSDLMVSGSGFPAAISSNSAGSNRGWKAAPTINSRVRPDKILKERCATSDVWMRVSSASVLGK